MESFKLMWSLGWDWYKLVVAGWHLWGLGELGVFWKKSYELVRLGYSTDKTLKNWKQTDLVIVMKTSCVGISEQMH